MTLRLDGISKSYASLSGAKVQALRDLALSVMPGEFVSVIGRSGCGKSTLLQIAAGLLDADAGTVSHRGSISMVFQSHSLFPWRTAESNVAYPLELAGTPRAEAQARARIALERVGIAELRSRFPRELSGGQAQRVALARAFVTRPSLLLMDEPFAALDALTRPELHLALESERALSEAAVLLVTHSLEEALRLSDRIVVLGGSPGEIKDEVLLDGIGRGLERGEWEVTRDFLEAKARLLSLLAIH